jgi:20S proteasome alpha/beta subunit
MQVSGTDKRLYSINLSTGGVINGVTPDGRSIIQRAREEVSQYENMFGIKCPGGILADRIAMKF